MKRTPRTRITIRLPAADLDMVKELCQELGGITVSEFVRDAIRRQIDWADRLFLAGELKRKR